MSRYTSSVPTREKTEEADGIPKPPTSCGVINCDNKADVLTVIVLENGRERAGAFCDFGFSKNGEKGRKFHLREGYVFVNWVARCSYHHLRDLYHGGKGRWSCMGNTDRLTPEIVKTWVPPEARA
jgi:hypothetical protein